MIKKLRAMGVSDAELSRATGSSCRQLNIGQVRVRPSIERGLTKLYSRLIGPAAFSRSQAH
jgi:hypothetical protein